MSILKVDTINEKTTGNGVYIPGHVIQTVNKTFRDVTSTTSTSYTDVNGGSLAITPKSTSSKIHVQFNFSLGYYGGNVYQYGGFQILRGSTVITFSPQDGTGTFEVGQAHAGITSVENYERYSHQLIDSPNTTSAVTYKAQLRSYGSGGGSMTINPGGAAVGTSHIILQEIAQ